MDRVISLLAALVGLIALGGAILVHTNADAQRQQMATEIAQLKASVSLLGNNTNASAAQATAATVQSPSMPATAPSAQPSITASPAVDASKPAAEPGVDDALLALQARVTSLEQLTRDQSSELETARAQVSSLEATPAQVATAGVPSVTPLAPASNGSAASASSMPPGTPAAVVADGPTKDCIPLGTRFMGAAGDSFPICKTKLVVKVAAVNDGLATINGAGDVAQGGIGTLEKGCNISVFSADITSGYAEMRVTCN
jgi:outer membrane murein-binding lipoprotein Lpp